MPLDAEQARELTIQIREAIAAVEQAGALLADRVRRAHQGRVWRALGYASWGEYAAAEFGISRAQAYRLIDIATTAGRLLAAATTAAGVSPAGDTLGLSGRALRDVTGRVDQVAARLTGLIVQVRSTGTELTGDDVAVLLRRAVAEVRHPPVAPLRPADGDKRPEVQEGRRLVAALEKAAAEIGESCLEIAPAYVSEAEASPLLAIYAEEIGLDLDGVMARRRYTITGDRRCLAAIPYPS